ncbi:antitoxin YezG family protein [Herbaspirillum camelliae]|uniref:hypothetical protein n=1 Tax=Herbaspirillum camelliae TaxID=1892903 RepID=UPI000A997196|nr:hypothetical protein [Herbaspirillum camelliae]
MKGNFHIDNEKIYKEIFNILAELAVEPWDYIKLSGVLLNENISGVSTIQECHSGESENISTEWRIFEIQDLLIRLRENFLRETGHRIWGFKFDFSRDGKFDVKLDYDKPVGFDDSSNMIGGDEINQSLHGLKAK